MASAIKKKVPLDTIVLETTGVADPLVFAGAALGRSTRGKHLWCVCASAKETAPCTRKYAKKAAERRDGRRLATNTIIKGLSDPKEAVDRCSAIISVTVPTSI